MGSGEECALRLQKQGTLFADSWDTLIMTLSTLKRKQTVCVHY